MKPALKFRPATAADASALAPMNHRLIRDEGHRNPMTVADLEKRMEGWLKDEYQAVVIEQAGLIVGYALFKREPQFVYLRHFFVRPESRRQGIGRAAIQWLRENPWKDERRIRVEALSGNQTGIAFWRSLGFEDYCLTLELQ